MPQTECPAQEEAWRSTTERTPGAFRRLMSQCGSGVENCLLPDSVAGFVEGEHCSVLLQTPGGWGPPAPRRLGGARGRGPKKAGRGSRGFRGGEREEKGEGEKREEKKKIKKIAWGGG